MLNKAIIMGRLTANPELRQTPSNISFCRISVAVDRNYGADKKTDFIPVIVWRESAEFVHKYFTKGSMIIVEGKLQNNNYTDQNGVKHYSMDVVAENVSFGETKSAKSGGQTAAPVQQNTAPSVPIPPIQQEPLSENELGNLKDFEEILGDGEVPFQ